MKLIRIIIFALWILLILQLSEAKKSKGKSKHASHYKSHKSKKSEKGHHKHSRGSHGKKGHSKKWKKSHPKSKSSDDKPVKNNRFCDRKAIGVYPNPEGCEKFYKCDGRRTLKLFCGTGFLFNSVARKCSVASKIDCKNGLGIPKSEPAVAQFCDRKAIGVYPNPEGCEKFYKCDGRRTLKLFCGTGFLFNSVARKCSVASKIDCKNGLGIPKWKPAGKSHSKHSRSHKSEKSKKSDKGKPKHASSHKSHKSKKSEKGHHKHSRGSHGKKSHSKKSSHSKKTKDSHGKKTHSKMSSKSINDCTHPKRVTCSSIRNRFNKCEQRFRNGESIREVTVLRVISRTKCVKGTNWGFDRNSIWTNNGCRAIFQLCIDANQFCDSKPPGLYPNPESCSKFYKCANGLTFNLFCGPATLFNSVTKTCHHARNIDCKNGIGYPKPEIQPNRERVCTDIECFIPSRRRRGNRKVCRIRQAKSVLSVEIKKNYRKNNSCVQDRTFGTYNSRIWVTKQCGGRFNVCYEKDSSDVVDEEDRRCGKNCGQNAFCNRRGRCQCDAGYVGDGTNCLGMCLCTGTGDPHYSQFDITNRKDMIHFMGACKYILSQLNTKERPECNFRVEVKNENLNGDYNVAWTRLVDVFVDGDRITLGPGLTVKINGVLSNTPYPGKGYKVDYSDRYLIVKTDCNNVIGFNGDRRVFVMAVNEFGDDLSGICGNCNGEKDDCVTPEGQTIELVNGICPYHVFGQSWSVPDDTEPEIGTCDVEVEDVEVPCTEETMAKAKAVGLCGILDLTNADSKFKREFEKQGIISDVTSYAETAFDDCVFDTCRTLENLGDGEDVACDMIHGFTNDVEEALAIEVPSWREDGFCMLDCGENEQFYDSLPCERTCADGNNDILCTMQTDAGCGCKDGYVRSGTACILKESCGCVHTDGKYYQLNEQMVSVDCVSEYQCQHIGGASKMVMTRRRRPCLRNVAECKPNTDGQYQCMCKEGYVGDGIALCENGCGAENLKCHPKATCVSTRTNRASTCKCNDGLTGDGVLNCTDTCTCTQWGDPHTILYDGQRMDFQGRCTYLLSEIKVTPACEMRVEVKHAKFERKPTVALTRIMYVTVAGDTIKIEQGRKVYRNGLIMYGEIDPSEGLPYTVINDGVFVIVENRCGMSAGFDGQHRGYVRIPRIYGLEAKGICGNCDGLKNDYVTSAGEDVSRNPNRNSAIGNSYLVTSEPKYANNENCDTAADTPEECDPIVKLTAQRQCAYLVTRTGPFQNCLTVHLADAQNIYEDCVFDYCAFAGEQQLQTKTVCSAIGKLNDICVENFDVGSWRNNSFCPAKELLGCNSSKHLIYNSAMSKCHATCQYQRKRPRCREEPMEGCECDRSDYLYDNDKCVPKQQCGCTRRVRGTNGNSKLEYFPIGTTVVSRGCRQQITCVHEHGRSFFKTRRLQGCTFSSETCQINDGSYQCICKVGYELVKGKCVKSCNGEQCHANGRCTRRGCKCKRGFMGDGVNRCDSRGHRCTCSAAGDPHYSNFDRGEMIHFMGVCKYTLSQLRSTIDDCRYNVEVQNERRYGNTYPSYTEYMDIDFRQYKVRLGQGGAVYVDGERVATTYEVTGQFRIIRDGRWISMETICNQQFRFDGDSTAQIDVPKQGDAQNYVGICGNCDGMNNDWVTRNGTDVSNMHGKDKYKAFGNGWLVGDEAGETHAKCMNEQVKEPKCSDSDRQTAKQNNMCGVMTNSEGPFRDCLNLPEVQPVVSAMFDSCVDDVCMTTGSQYAQESVMCEMAALLAAICDGAGVIVTWRSSNFCPLECKHPHMHYESDITGCPDTCQGVSKCTEPPSEGCVCDQGYVLSDIQCVRREECGCTHTEIKRGQLVDVYVELGVIKTSADCSKLVCDHIDGKSKMVVVKGMEACDGATSECVNVDGSYTCVCRKGFTGVNGYQCRPDVTEMMIEQSPETVTVPVTERTTPPTTQSLSTVTPSTPPSPVIELTTTPATTSTVTDATYVVLTTLSESEKTNDVTKQTTDSLPPTPPAPRITTQASTAPPTSLPIATTAQSSTNVVERTNPASITDKPEVVSTSLESEESSKVSVEEASRTIELSDDGESEVDILPCDPEDQVLEPTLPPKPSGTLKECISNDDPTGLLYWGSHNKTTSGRKCQRWMDQYPHRHPYSKLLAAEENYCRNRPLSGTVGFTHPWCYTNDRNHEWEYCNIASCDGAYPAPTPPPPEADRGCYNILDYGTGYEGPISSTYDGEVCDSWRLNGFGYDDNFCRNPLTDGRKHKPWCFVSGVRKYCDVPICFKPPIGDVLSANCKIDIQVSVCSSVTTMSGSCEQTLSFPGQCEYTVQQVTKQRYRLFLVTDEQVIELYVLGKIVHVSDTCGRFELVDNKIVVTSPTCGMCMRSTYTGLLSNSGSQERGENAGFCKVK